MPKIAYISDVHLEFRLDLVLPIIDGDHTKFGALGFPETLDADLLVVAGDIHPNKAMRDRFTATLQKAYGIPVITVNGNHDYYGSDFPTDQGEIHSFPDLGITVATATLWTNLTPMEEMRAYGFADFKHINNISVSLWNYTHHEQWRFLQASNADVIVTHHAPSYQSVHERFRGYQLNGFFANNLDLSLFPKTKLWIHGHVHNVFDYIENGIRVVCNPLGYPFERHHHPVAVKIVEV